MKQKLVPGNLELAAFYKIELQSMGRSKDVVEYVINVTSTTPNTTRRVTYNDYETKVYVFFERLRHSVTYTVSLENANYLTIV